MALRDAVTKINNIISDLSSLHVQTYTGSVTVDLDNLGADENGMDRVRDAVRQARADGNVTLVAEAYYQFDGDSYNFLTTDDVPLRALEIHTAAVEAGMKTRRAIVELVKGVL